MIRISGHIMTIITRNIILVIKIITMTITMKEEVDNLNNKTIMVYSRDVMVERMVIKEDFLKGFMKKINTHQRSTTQLKPHSKN